MKRPLQPVILLLLVLALLNFQPFNKQPASQRGFYHWDTYFQVIDDDRSLLSYQVSKLYIKFFDIEYDNEEAKAIPGGVISFGTAIPEYINEIIPVVFITNETISKLDSTGIENLSEKIILRLQNETKRTRITHKVKEWQFDCDWTIGTRNKYFYLLRLLKSGSTHPISSTIRLHQYKYSRNNIPPVDRGVLMCYNVDDPRNFDTKNSIFSYEEVMKYIENVTYPLPLDIALPVFSWGVLFNSRKEFEGFSGKILLKDIKADSSFSATGSDNIFVSNNSGEKYGRYFLKGNMVRVENIDYKEVIKVKKYLQAQLRKSNSTIILFRYDPFDSTILPANEITAIFESH